MNKALNLATTRTTKPAMAQHTTAVLVLFAATSISLQSQTFTTLHSFDGTDGNYPLAGLVQGTDGNFYGTTSTGGSYDRCSGGCGTIFKITPAGTLTTIYNFCADTPYCTDGANPVAGLVLGSNGNLYGVTGSGGSQSNSGTVFQVSPSGILTTLHAFCAESDPPACPDGWYPAGGLVRTTGGELYGTTSYSEAAGLGGTIFEINASGGFSTVYNFCSQLVGGECADGASPQAALLQAANGEFYGTTRAGGDCQVGGGCGTVFRLTSSGALTTLYSFCSNRSICTDGQSPAGGLIQASNGSLYGTTYEGGSGGGGGTVFEITPSGTLTTLYSFCGSSGCATGASDPLAGLIQATNGYLYGTTQFGGPGGFGGGEIFNMTLGGVVDFIYGIPCQTSCTNGSGPFNLIEATNGVFYGTTENGGSSNACENGCGTVFSFSVGLSPFVEAMPASGKVGSKVEILGTVLTGATSVSFSGSAALFSVVSNSEIIAVVPSGAISGRIQVITPNATLKSNVVFRVSQ